MISISFMTANYVAREVSYHMTGGWGEGDRAANSYFEPIATYRERLDPLLGQVKALGFSNIGLWCGHLNWKWATDEHVKIAKQLLKKHGLRPLSYAGGFGENLAEFERACIMAKQVGIPILAGMTPLIDSDKKGIGNLLKTIGVKLAYENHPEKTPKEVLKHLQGTDEEYIGAAVDTGWFGTQGYDAARALHELRDRLFDVHLKDVVKPGGHTTCPYGKGCVPIEECVNTLKKIKYLGEVCVEHEPELYDPSEECRQDRELLERWLAQ